jgi:hypothetical protein
MWLPLKKLTSWITSLVVTLTFAVSVFAAPSDLCRELFAAHSNYTPVQYDSLVLLKSQYQDQIKLAKQRRSSDLDVDDIYGRLYSIDYGNFDPQVSLGNAIGVYSLWAEWVDKAKLENWKFKETRTTLDPPDANLVTELGISALKQAIKNHCESRCSALNAARTNQLVNDFFKVLDLRGAAGGYSGFPFFSIYQKRFLDPDFMTKAIRLQNSLAHIIDESALDPKRPIDENILDLATKANDGDKRKAIEMVSLLLSRDTGIIRYFNYLQLHSNDADFATAVSMIPVEVRLIAEIDKARRGSDLDRFSYDGKYATRNIKNYYFWSAAFVAMRLSDLGYTSNEIVAVTIELPRQYKIFRKIQSYLPSKAILLASGALGASLDIAAPGDPTHRLIAGGGIGAVALATGWSHSLSAFKPAPALLKRDYNQVIRNSGEGARSTLLLLKKQ